VLVCRKLPVQLILDSTVAQVEIDSPGVVVRVPPCIALQAPPSSQ
jgi:hypothetical protein